MLVAPGRLTYICIVPKFNGKYTGIGWWKEENMR
jgi:hypothetical protein